MFLCLRRLNGFAVSVLAAFDGLTPVSKFEWLDAVLGSLFNVQSLSMPAKKRATHTDYPKFVTILKLNYFLFFKNSSDLFISLYIIVSS